MIVFEPLGGLGNQLFTYALGLENATRLRTGLHVDLCNFVNYEWHSYELGGFNSSISGEIQPSFLSKIFKRLPGQWRVKRFLSRVLQRLPGHWYFGLRKLALEDDERFATKFLEVPDGTRLRGYFQSWKYFESVGHVIQSELWDLVSPSKAFLEKKLELESGAPWIAVHVRLGNYQAIPGMGLAGRAYYRRAVTLLRDLGHREKILVFTDSPEVIGKMGLFEDVDDWHIFQGGPDLTSLETLLLMSLADHLVMGNSTFSWWAAWLGRGVAGRRIVYPRPWLDFSPRDDRDIPMPAWICLSREENILEEGKE